MLATHDVPYTIAPSWQPALRAYCEELRQRSGSTHTPRTYGRHVRNFMAIAGQPELASAADVHAYCYGARDRGVPGAEEVRARLKAVKGFLGFLVRMGRLPSNVADKVKAPTHPEAMARGLSIKEIRDLMHACPTTPSGERDRSIIYALALTGLRIGELLPLTRGALTESGGRWLYVTRVKGGGIRRREMPTPVVLNVRHALKAQDIDFDTMDSEGRLFPIEYGTFRLNLASCARRAGVVATAHTLRHSAAKLRRDNGATLEDVAKFLGHKSLATTARYLARLEGEADDGWQAVAAQL